MVFPIPVRWHLYIESGPCIKQAPLCRPSSTCIPTHHKIFPYGVLWIRNYNLWYPVGILLLIHALETWGLSQHKDSVSPVWKFWFRLVRFFTILSFLGNPLTWRDNHLPHNWTSWVSWTSFMHITTWVGVTKAQFVNFSINKIHDLAEVPVMFFESHSYLTGVATAQLRQHLSNIKVIFNS